MTHSLFRDRLITLANENASNPNGFLEQLSDIHNDWHSETLRTYGFLLFHHRVVRYFKTIVNTQRQTPIVAFTTDDFRSMNVMPFNFNVASVDTLNEMANFSSVLESWHNTAHGRIGSATGTPMMDPQQNIFFQPFWQLHFYIDDLFQTVLQQYGNIQHANQFVDVEAIASHLEVSHHSWVSRI